MGKAFIPKNDMIEKDERLAAKNEEWANAFLALNISRRRKRQGEGRIDENRVLGVQGKGRA